MQPSRTRAACVTREAEVQESASRARNLGEECEVKWTRYLCQTERDREVRRHTIARLAMASDPAPALVQCEESESDDEPAEEASDQEEALEREAWGDLGPEVKLELEDQTPLETPSGWARLMEQWLREETQRREARERVRSEVRQAGLGCRFCFRLFLAHNAAPTEQQVCCRRCWRRAPPSLRRAITERANWTVCSCGAKHYYHSEGEIPDMYRCPQCLEGAAPRLPKSRMGKAGEVDFWSWEALCK